MRKTSSLLGSARFQRAGDGILPSRTFWKIVSAECRKSEPDWQRHARGMRSPESRVLIFLMISLAILNGSSTRAITLDQVLDQTLQKNPAIQQAKLNLEQAAGHRIVLRSITWPNIRAIVPAGVQGGHRAGESTKPFIFARGIFSQPLLNFAIAPSRHLGDVEVLIAEKQLNVAVVQQLHAARVAF